MPTDNPKISAYVPQVVFDKVENFRRQRGLSMSQAAIVIFAEYFGIEQAVREFTEGIIVGGVTITRLENIEHSIEQLTLMFHESNCLPSESNSSLLSRLNSVTEKIPRLEERLGQLEYWKNEVTPDVKIHETQLKSVSSLLNELSSKSINDLSPVVETSDLNKSEQLKTEKDNNLLNKSFEASTFEVELNSSLPNKILNDLSSKTIETSNPIEQFSLVSSLLGEPKVESICLSGVKLSELRFKLSKDTVAGHKRKDTLNAFIQWAKSVDPDGIGWIPNPKGDGYIPKEDTSSELLSRLQIWIEENIPKN